ncbi:MAG: Glycerate kinase, partial [Acidimicrobiales bacterium]|nr:Glycerate kinase [Acidimicrobiales bacterium]
LDAQSFQGKAVGGVAEVARETGVPVLVVVGDVYRDELPAGELERLEVVSLVERFGEDRARSDVLRCVQEVVVETLRARGAPR